MTVPLCVLDLSPIPEGADAATALRNTVDLAQHAEQWLSLIHISEPTRLSLVSRMPSSA